MSVSFLRHSGWVSPDTINAPLSIIGVGATGSNIALLAARMGFTKFKLWDPDVVEPHNLPNQTYDNCHIGKPKVTAMKEVLQRFNPEIEVETHKCYFTTAEHKTDLEGVLLVTVDTMSARKDIFESMKMNWRVCAIFETRLGFSSGECYILDPMDLEALDKWAATLVDDNEIEDGPCNLQMCSTLVYEVAGYAVHMMCGHFAAKHEQKEWTPPRRKLFLLEDDLQVFTMK